MTITMKSPGIETTGFPDRYKSALVKFLTAGGESALVDASELGRHALGRRTSILDILSVHKQALADILPATHDEGQRAKMAVASSEFLAECVSPYELAHRGFQDALKALRQINETLEAEIKRVAYAVHDEAGQLLVAVRLALVELSSGLSKAEKPQVKRIEDLLDQVEEHLRQYSHELRPTVLDHLGLIPAIHQLADGVSKRAGLQIHIRTGLSERLPGSTEIVLYRIVQEALTNAVKHAKAKNVWLHAWWEECVLCCSIKDDGAGFVYSENEGSSHRGGLGLIAIRERLNAIGGDLQINSVVGKGTQLSIRLPVERSCVNSHSASR